MWIILIQVIFSLAMFVNAVLFIPQAVKLLKTKTADNVSFITFMGFNLIQLAIVAHGLMVKDYLLVAGMSLTFVTCGSVTFLILFYNYHKLYAKCVTHNR